MPTTLEPELKTAKQRRRMSRTGAMIHALDKFVWSRPEGIARDHGMTKLGERLTESYKHDAFDLMEDIDHDAVLDFYQRKDDRFRDAVGHIKNNPALFKRGTEGDRLRESLTSAIELSQFERYLDNCVRLGTFSFCRTQNVDCILDLVGKIQVDCTTETLSTDPFLIEDDFEPANPVESETPMGGLADPVEIKVPKRHYVKIGYGLNRDMFCQGLGQRIQSVIEENIGPKFDKRMANYIVPLIFNAYCPGENPWAFNMDGCSWETYYAPNAGAEPWDNMTFAAETFDSCQHGMFCTVEEKFDAIEHPRTGDSMSCVDSWNIVAGGGRCTAEKFRNLLGVLRVEAGGDGTASCNETIQFNRAAREGWGAIRWCTPMTKRLRQSYTAIYGTGTTANFSDAEVKQMVERTWVAGSTQEAFQLATEWEREEVTLQGTQTYEYWNQEILWMKKWSEKWGLLVKNPWAVQIVQGLPDGKVGTDLACA